jgi:hypothetical protein
MHLSTELSGVYDPTKLVRDCVQVSSSGTCIVTNKTPHIQARRSIEISVHTCMHQALYRRVCECVLGEDIALRMSPGR